MDLIRFTVFDSSLGNIVLVSKNGRLIELDITDEDGCRVKERLSAFYSDALESPESFNKTCKLLNSYLNGERVDFDSDVDISCLGVFTRKVLEEARRIPYGELRSYNWIGKRLGYGSAGRAVGQALGRNPIPIIIPCHRVIREDGSLGGFSMGLQIKKRLLATEGICF